MMTPSAETPAYQSGADGLGTERAQQNGELTHEAVQAGQAHRGKRDDQHDRSKDGRDLPQPAVDLHLAGVRLFVDHADEKEQRARADAVIDHLQDAALRCPAGFSAKRPSITKPRWLTEEYATSFLTSFWA